MSIKNKINKEIIIFINKAYYIPFAIITEEKT
jgi:hypothetical protein